LYVYITADRPPKEIFNAKDKAVKIFQKGLVLKIEPPVYNVRLKFLQTKARNAGLSFSNDIFEDLARKAHPDFRTLEGILAKIKLSFSSAAPPQ
jgi:chromosomal replication initiator protein